MFSVAKQLTRIHDMLHVYNISVYEWQWDMCLQVLVWPEIILNGTKMLVWTICKILRPFSRSSAAHRHPPKMLFAATGVSLGSLETRRRDKNYLSNMLFPNCMFSDCLVLMLVFFSC